MLLRRYYISLRLQLSSLGGGLIDRKIGEASDSRNNGSGNNCFDQQLAKGGYEMRGRRLSISVGSSFRDHSAGNGKRTDLLSSYSEKVLTDGYRAYLRGDKLNVRAEHFMEQSKSKTAGHSRHSRPTEVSRLRHMEGRFEWVLTLREKVTHFVLSACKINHYNRLQRRPVRRPKTQ